MLTLLSASTTTIDVVIASAIGSIGCSGANNSTINNTITVNGFNRSSNGSGDDVLSFETDNFNIQHSNNSSPF